MRQLILDEINDLNLGSFTLSTELPWDSSGTPLYLRNLKKIYVDRPEFNQETIIATLDGVTIRNETTSVRAFFACDAKALPPNFDDVITEMKTVKDLQTAQGFRARDCVVNSSFQDDVLVTELTYSFEKLTT